MGLQGLSQGPARKKRNCYIPQGSGKPEGCGKQAHYHERHPEAKTRSRRHAYVNFSIPPVLYYMIIVFLQRPDLVKFAETASLEQAAIRCLLAQKVLLPNRVENPYLGASACFSLVGSGLGDRVLIDGWYMYLCITLQKKNDSTECFPSLPHPPRHPYPGFQRLNEDNSSLPLRLVKY